MSTSNDNLYREIMPSDKLPTKNGDYICILKSDNSGYDPRVRKVEWWNNSDSHRDYWLGSVQCWLEKIEADQQEKQLSDAKAEIERLKGLLKTWWVTANRFHPGEYSANDAYIEIMNQQWAKFKTENNL